MSESLRSEAGNVPEYSVSELSGALKRMVEENFAYVRVRGEVSGYRGPHSSGHVYFALKDDSAKIDAVIWKGSFGRMKVKPEEGLEVVAIGRLTTYPGRSNYQIVIESLELAGLGALMAMLEARRKKLAAEGLFDEARKKPLPFLPEVIGVITSPTGAVLRDIMHRLRDRCPRQVLLWAVAVQGERAAAEVAAAIEGFNALPEGGPVRRPDVIIVARGGGSLEDLMAFNEEIVVRAAAASKIPLISAVGHETDTTLIDYASDRRAPTPTAAAEMAVPVLRELVEATLSLHQRLLRALSRGQDHRRQVLSGLARALPRADSLFALPRQKFDGLSERLPRSLTQNLQRHEKAFARIGALLRPRAISVHIAQGAERTKALQGRLARSYGIRLQRGRTALDAAGRVLETVSYRSILARGFALVRGEDGTLRRQAAEVQAGETLRLAFADGEASAQALEGGAPAPKAKASPKKETAQKKGGNQGDLF